MPVAGVGFLYLRMQTPNCAFCRCSRAAARQTRVVTPAGPGWGGGVTAGPAALPPRRGAEPPFRTAERAVGTGGMHVEQPLPWERRSR